MEEGAPVCAVWCSGIILGTYSFMAFTIFGEFSAIIVSNTSCWLPFSSLSGLQRLLGCFTVVCVRQFVSLCKTPRTKHLRGERGCSGSSFRSLLVPSIAQVHSEAGVQARVGCWLHGCQKPEGKTNGLGFNVKNFLH